MMHGMGVSGGFFMIVMIALVVIPFWKILPRSGIPSWVAIFAFIPLVALVLLWIIAFKDDGESSKGNA